MDRRLGSDGREVTAQAERGGQPSAEERPHAGVRALLALVGVMLLTLLGVAWLLRPSGAGLGTHQQLGLPPCGWQTAFGIRCPSCGMTTSWSWLTRGRLDQAISVSAGGTLLGLVSMLVAPWALVIAGWGRWFWRPEPWTAVSLVTVLLGVTFVDWLGRFQ